MVGKPDIRADGEDQGDIGAADAPKWGWSALDQDRQASLADEGGRAGAVIEGQDEDRPAARPSGSRSTAPRRRLGLILAAAGLLIGAFLIRRRHPKLGLGGSL